MAASSHGEEASARGEAPVAGRYRIESELARGGMGVVSSALDESTGSRVAIKRVHPELAAQRRVRLLFELEYRTLAMLEHPVIIQVFDYGVDAGLPFYTMELLDGQDLRELSPLPWRDACRYLCDVASSLALLHTRHLLHRDLSPRNVRRTSEGHCKLLDFGTMCQFGVPPNIAGTPPFVPPEAIQGGALDHRTDIYSLGALAYYLLTRRNAYPVGDIESLRDAWRIQPARPSKFAEDIPPDLDDLVLSMLSLDPLSRPSGAADVIERLTAVAGLHTRDTSEVVESYLLSSPLTGRDRELDSLEQRIARLKQGQGAALLFEGNVGFGKTRMLDELSLRARAAGAAAVRVDAHAHRAPAAVLVALARALRVALPYEAERALAPYRRKLGAVLEQSRAGATSTLGEIGAASGMGAPVITGAVRPVTATGAILAIGASLSESSAGRESGESRARLQDAMNGWILAVSKKHPLLVMVDDLHRADELSAAFLAALVRETRDHSLILAATRRSGEPVTAPDAFDSFRAAAARYRLSRLQERDTAQLVQSLFGRVPNLALLSDFLHRKSGGNPGLCIELARQLVDRGLVRYAGGMWVLPDELDEGLLPESFADAFRLRLQRLPEPSRMLAEAFCIRRGFMPLELCAAVVDLDDEALFTALERLVQDGMLVMSGEGYGFAHDGMREVVRSAIEPERRKGLHLRLAEALLQSAGDNPETQLEAGFHLVSAGHELRGADLMARVAPMMAKNGVAMETAIPALERALRIYEQAGRRPADSLRLRNALVRSSYVYDYRLADRYGEETLGQLLYHTGLDTADRLRPFLGATLSFLAGGCWAILRRLFTPRRRRGPTIIEAFTYYAGAVMSMMGVRTASLDVTGTRALMHYVEKFSGAIGRHGLRAIYLVCRALLLQPQGREAELRQAADKALALLEHPRLFGLDETDHKDVKAGMMQSAAINECYRKRSLGLEQADALEETGTKMGRAAALRMRMTHHMLRGDSEQTEKYRAQLELHAIQGGTIWQVQWYAVPVEGMAAVRTADLVTLKRVIRELDRLVEVKPSLGPLRKLIVIGYHFRRNDLEKTCELGEAFIAEHPPRSIIGWGHGYAALAAAHLLLADYGRALQVCRMAISALTEADREYIWMYGTLELLTAAAEGGKALQQGNAEVVERALGRLERFIHEREAEESPLLMYEANEIKVRIGEVLGFGELFQQGLEQMYGWARLAGNPAMLAHCERVAEHGIRRGVPSTIPPPVDAAAGGEVGVTVVRKDGAHEALGEVFAKCAGSDERARQALRLIAQRTQSDSAYLYLRREGGVVLAGALSVAQPPDTLEQRVLSLLDDEVVTAASFIDLTGEMSSSIGSEENSSPYRIRVLPARVGKSDAMIGAVAFSSDLGRATDISPAYLRAIAQHLYRNGDACT